MTKLITANALLQALPPLAKGARLWIAYSGGCDSHVLLHLLHQLQSQLQSQRQVQLHAIHINHGLSPYADQWTEHCHDICAELEIPLRALKVDARPQPGQSPEEAARHARYQAITGQLVAGDYLCTAHHQDDQAETLLLQLLRGAGPKGLAAMGRQSALGCATQLRPMLHLSREEVQHYAEVNNFKWIDDRSNSDTRFDRNYLRHEVLPKLKQRWPAAARTISRSADHCAETTELLQHLAEQDWQPCCGPSNATLSIAAVQALPLARKKNLLRYWIGINGLPLPSEVKLHHLINDVMGAAEDGMPCVAWPGTEVRRHDGQIHIMPPLVAMDSGAIISWPDLNTPLPLPDGRTLRCVPTTQVPALSASHLQQGNVTIRYRHGGERLQPVNSPHHKTLKQIFQEQRIPHWQRDRIPLVYLNETLVAVVGVCLAQSLAVFNEDEARVMIIWQ